MKGLIKKHQALIVQFLKFGMIGGFGFVVDNAFTYFGTYVLGLDPIPAGLFSFPFAVTSTWFGNRIFTFAHARREPMGKQWTRFFAVCAVGLVFNRGTYSFLVQTIPLDRAHLWIGLLGGTLVAMFFNFFAARKLVFR